MGSSDGYDQTNLGMAEVSSTSLRGAVVSLVVSKDLISASNLITVYKGGFWRFALPTTRAPLPAGGVLGRLEFRDGKGRLDANRSDLGALLFSFPARSGLRNGADETVEGGGGHVPRGWYFGYRRTDFSGNQRDSRNSQNGRVTIRQGAYVRWQQDDARSAEERYTNDFVYNSRYERDRRAGLPRSVMFKWQLVPIAPNTAHGRTQLQIHPDGRRNGTRGCIGIQNYSDCLSVNRILTNYNQCNLLVETE